MTDDLSMDFLYILNTRSTDHKAMDFSIKRLERIKKVCIYIYICMYMCMYVCLYVCMYVYMYVCMYGCMYICMTG